MPGRDDFSDIDMDETIRKARFKKTKELFDGAFDPSADRTTERMRELREQVERQRSLQHRLAFNLARLHLGTRMREVREAIEAGASDNLQGRCSICLILKEAIEMGWIDPDDPTTPPSPFQQLQEAFRRVA